MQTKRHVKYEATRRRQSQVVECSLRTSSCQEPSEHLKTHIKRSYYGGYTRQYGQQEKWHQHESECK